MGTQRRLRSHRLCRILIYDSAMEWPKERQPPCAEEASRHERATCGTWCGNVCRHATAADLRLRFTHYQYSCTPDAHAADKYLKVLRIGSKSQLLTGCATISFCSQLYQSVTLITRCSTSVNGGARFVPSSVPFDDPPHAGTPSPHPHDMC